jgi:chemotaxis protein CheD
MSHTYETHSLEHGSERRVHVVQGEYFVSDEPNVMLTTILGSCVAACIRDPMSGLGGMNHFLLPDGGGDKSATDSVRYGAYAMELLVNGLLRQGARRDRLEAKLFGGARLINGLTDIGKQNADFAERFLKQEGIAFAGGSLRGDHARRVQFWPQSGRVRQMALTKDDAKVFEVERRIAPMVPVESGAVELF